MYHRVLRDGIRLLAREGRALSRYCDWVAHAAKLDPVARARLVHAGTIRVRGRAPDALVWELPAPPAGGRLHL